MFSIFADNISTFLKNHSMATIATVDEEGQPHSSTIYYVMNRHDKIRFITKTATNKFQNLEQNNRAAMTVVDEEKPIAVNLIGSADLLSEKEDHDEIMQQIMEMAHDALGDYAPIVKLHRGSFVVMEFTPTHADLNDFTKQLGLANTEAQDY